MIKVLSQETINKIAAGEVVERPLNAVKEIVENSLDACADNIIIEIEQAGKKLIRVSDNGFGMDKKDLELSVLRHATSKISDFNDLEHIQSLGFRGEALSSIAAVSKFVMKTKKKGAPEGWQLTTEGGKNIKIVPSSGSNGTITEVKDLFFNTPARRKFLKTDATERTKIVASCEETALANPEISFKLLSDGKTVFSANKTNNKIERISDILGRQFASVLKNVKAEHEKVLIDIYFTGRDDSQNNKKYQYLFVNSRPVNLPKWLVHCVYNAYKESIPREKHPGFLVYIIIEPSDIDVNIHPTKREVKFSDESQIYDLLYKTLRNALTTQVHPNIQIQSEKCKVKSENKNIINHDGHSASHFSHSALSFMEPQKRWTTEQYASVFAKPSVIPEDCNRESAVNPLPFVFDENIKVLGQAFDTYIIVENRGELYIFDQHAAAERVRYELYLAQLKSKKLKSQQMLIPETFELSASLSSLLKYNLSLLNELGINIEEFGDKSFRITEYPALLGNISIEQIIRKIIDDLEIEKNIDIEKKRDKIIRSACRASIKAGDNVAPVEAKKLINDLFKCDFPFTCPHGRPTAYKISLNDLEKFFKRK